MLKASYRVPNMRCSGCSMALEGLEDKLPGISHISASYHKQRLDVEYDERQLSSAQIIAAAGDLGYTLIPV
jgi:copper chaperone CopZ